MVDSLVNLYLRVFLSYFRVCHYCYMFSSICSIVGTHDRVVASCSTDRLKNPFCYWKISWEWLQLVSLLLFACCFQLLIQRSKVCHTSQKREHRLNISILTTDVFTRQIKKLCFIIVIKFNIRQQPNNVPPES